MSLGLSQSTSRQIAESRFFSKVMTWLMFAFASTAVGIVILGPLVPAGLQMPLYFVALAVLLFSGFVRKAAPYLAGPLAIGIPAILGIIFYPLLNSYVNSGMGGILIEAAVGTAVVFGSMALWGWTTKKDLSGWYKPMFFAVLGIIAISLLNIFVFRLGFLEIAIASAVLIAFSIYTVMDIQRLKIMDRNGSTEHPGVMALSIFLDIWNIFASLLRILSIFNR